MHLSFSIACPFSAKPPLKARFVTNQPWNPLAHPEAYAGTGNCTLMSIKILENLVSSGRITTSEPEHTECGICLRSYENDSPTSYHHAVKLPCNHIFGESCLRQWFKPLNTDTEFQEQCPICRHATLIEPCHDDSFLEAWIRVKLWDTVYQELDILPAAFEKQTRKLSMNFLARGSKSGVALEASGGEWVAAIELAGEKFRHFADRLGFSYMDSRRQLDVRKRMMLKVHLQAVHPGRYASEHDLSQHLNSQAANQRLRFALTFLMWFREVQADSEAAAREGHYHHSATVVKRDGRTYNVKISKRADIKSYLEGRLEYQVVQRDPAQRWSC